MLDNKDLVKKTVYSALNCRTFQGFSRDEFLFGKYDKAVNML